MNATEPCTLHPERRKMLKCLRYEIELCDHPDCATCVQPYAVCNKRKFCDVWKQQGAKPR